MTNSLPVFRNPFELRHSGFFRHSDFDIRYLPHGLTNQGPIAASAYPGAKHVPSEDGQCRRRRDRVRADVSFALHTEAHGLAISRPGFGRSDDIAAVDIGPARATHWRDIDLRLQGTLLAELPAAPQTPRE